MAQHKHNKPCAHRHSDLWWPSKVHKPLTVTFTFTFIRRFYPKRLTVHSGYTFVLSVCVFPGNRTHNLCAANAML